MKKLILISFLLITATTIFSWHMEIPIFTLLSLEQKSISTMPTIIASRIISPDKNEYSSDSIVKDMDGNIYRTVRIGNQAWMTENLKTTTFNDGTPIEPIPYIGSNQMPSTAPPGFCWPQNDSLNKNTYGALYNWFAVNTGKLAPNGWHIPSENDFRILINYLGGESIAGQKLNDIGFKAQGAGQLGYMGTWEFNLFPDLDKYWTTTSGGWEPTDIKYVLLTRINPKVGWSSHPKDAAHSVRCIKN